MKKDTVNIVMNLTYSYEALTFEVEHNPHSTFMQRAAQALAAKMLAEGCLVHKSEYSILRQATHEVVTVLTGRPQHKLP